MYCTNCGNKINDNSKFCDNCGCDLNNFNNPQKQKKKKSGSFKVLMVLLFGVLPLVLILVAFSIGYDNANVDYSKYQELNPQTLHNDFINNKIKAEEKYSGNYYYFTGTVHNIESFATDNYAIFRYDYKKDKMKTIELDAYFQFDSEELKSLNKGDKTTVYCKFDKRTIKSYKNTITTYSFEECRLKK